MDIQFVEEKHRDSVFQLMEMTSLNISDAYQLFINADYNLQNAIQMHFARNQPPPFEEKMEEPVQKPKVPNYQSQDFDEQYERYQIFKANGQSFGDLYQVRKEQKSFLNSFIPKFMTGGNNGENAFKKKVESYIGKTCQIKYSVFSLSHTIEEEACKNKFPVIVQILKFDAPSKAKIASIFNDPQLTEMLNVQFQNFGLDPSEYELEEDLRPFVNVKNDTNSFIVLRVNTFNEIEGLGKLKLTEMTAQTIRKQLKLMKNICIQKEMDEVHLEKRYNQELMGNFNYVKPVSMSERRKIAEDRAIRKKQEEEFYASMKAQQQKQLQKQEQINKPVVIQDHTKPQSVSKKEVSVEDIQKKRKQMRDAMTIYEAGMMIKMRLPSGESLRLTVDAKQNASYLYNYIESYDGECGFENEKKRSFDIIRPYDQLNLTAEMNKSLHEIFEGSDMENLAVREKE